MHDFETLVGELLSSRPGLTREELMLRISTKKETVGAGYLTDQGALFLVAGEMGVALQKNLSSEMPMRDLYIGANDVTTVARILAIYPTATYKKKDGAEGRYRRMVLFDGRHTTRLTLWDEKTGEVERLKLGIDFPLRIQNGYVRQGLDGKPDLSLGKRGSLIVVSEAEVSTKLANLESITEKLAGIFEERQYPSVECVMDSEPRFSEFVRSDGSSGSLFQFGVCDAGGRYRTRIVIWSPTEKPELKRGQKIVITSLKSRRSSNGGFEIHGDGGSLILPGAKSEPIVLRIVTISKGLNGRMIVSLEKTGRVRVVDAGEEISELAEGVVVKVVPEFEMNGRLVCKNEGAIEVVHGIEFPTMKSLATKLKDVKGESSQIMVEVIALSHGTIDEIRLKDGSLVKKGDLMVGDDTSEMKVIGWRDQAEKLQGIQPGERLRISGASPKLAKTGGWELGLNPLAVIEKISGRD
jgi:replication factor A1